MSTIIGDVLISTAFMAYAGYFDQHMRQGLFTNWCTHLQQANIQFRNDIARVEVSPLFMDFTLMARNSLGSNECSVILIRT